MPLKFFHIQTKDAERMEAELNGFLARHRIVTIERRFVDCGTDSFWALCVDYLHGDPGSGTSHGVPGRADRKVDYKDVLTPPQFEVFAKLRDLRKQTAEQEAVPVYAVFTNEQLAEMVRQGVRDVAGLRKIPGIGDAKVERYADAFLALLKCTAAATEPCNGRVVSTMPSGSGTTCAAHSGALASLRAGVRR